MYNRHLFVRVLPALVVGLALLLVPQSAEAQRKKKKKKRRKSKVTVPLNIGVGPAAYFFSPGPVGEDQTPHYGLQLSLNAVIDRKTLKKNKRKIPKKYRKSILKMKEMRISHILIPDSFILSPKTENTGIYGVTFRPLAVGVPLVYKPVRLHVGVGLRVTYAYIDTEYSNTHGTQTDGGGSVLSSRALPEGTTHFFRPGLDARVDLEIPVSKTFLVSVGWTSAVYIPQEVHGGDFWSVGDTDTSIWHIGQAYAMLHFRIPYTTRM